MDRWVGVKIGRRYSRRWADVAVGFWPRGEAGIGKLWMTMHEDEGRTAEQVLADIEA